MNILALHGLRETPETSNLVKAFPSSIAPIIDLWHPRQTWERVMAIVEKEEVDLIVGYSLGGFFATTLLTPTPIILFNPALDLINMMRERKKPKEKIIEELESLPHPRYPNIKGIFATEDERIGMRGLRVFRERWPEGEVRFIPGGHTLDLETFKKESGN